MAVARPAATEARTSSASASARDGDLGRLGVGFDDERGLGRACGLLLLGCRGRGGRSGRIPSGGRLRRATLRFGRASPQIGELGLAGLVGSPHRCLALAFGAHRCLRPCQLRRGCRQRGVDLGHGLLGGKVRRRHRQRQDAPCGGHALLRGVALLDGANLVALEAGQHLRQPLDRQADVGHRDARCLDGPARASGHLCPLGQAAGKGRHRVLGGGQVAHRRVDLRPRRRQPFVGLGRLPCGRRPSRTAGRQQPIRQLAGRVAARDLLFGLRRQATRLGPELAEDVTDPSQVGLGFHQPLLGLTSSTLVASHAGRLLEQRSSFLGAQGERLIDHALADEQEGVVGQVGGIEEIDEVAQAHLLAIEQVLVLARAEEPSTALDESVFDRQQTIVVADDEAHVGHARGVPAGGTGEDDVLRLAGSQRAALLAERPPQGIGEIALAAAIGTDDGADAWARTRAAWLRRRT